MSTYLPDPKISHCLAYYYSVAIHILIGWSEYVNRSFPNHTCAWLLTSSSNSLNILDWAILGCSAQDPNSTPSCGEKFYEFVFFSQFWLLSWKFNTNVSVCEHDGKIYSLARSIAMTPFNRTHRSVSDFNLERFSVRTVTWSWNQCSI